MTILSGDIKIKKSQVMLQTSDGGGAMTNNVVVDGQSNNMFRDIDEIDRVYGKVDLAKVFVHVDTNNTASAFQVHAIISKMPADPRVSVNLFTTKDWFDRRPALQNYIENYLAKGVRWEGHLLETQIAGQRAIQISIDEASTAVPAIGQTLVLVNNEGLSTEVYQYVRVTEVSVVKRNFMWGATSRVRQVVTLGISDPLRYDFIGQSVNEFLSNNKPIAILRDTRVADSAKYYGISKLVNPANLNTAQIQVESIFAQIVPSAQAETPLIDLDAAGQSTTFVEANASTISQSVTTVISATQNLFLGSSVMPKTVSFTLFGVAISDSGGELKNSSGVTVGTIDYASGLITWNSNAGAGAATFTINYQPAVAASKPQSTFLRTVTADNRGYNWTNTLVPIPAPGTLIVSYTAQGKVYSLRDNGAGQLKGADSSMGSGTVSFETGTVLLTTGALPDVGTAILYTWGNKLSLFARADMPIGKAYLEIESTQGALISASSTITWLLNGVEKTATDDGLGKIIGDATGTIDYSGRIKLAPNILPEPGTIFTLNAQFGPASVATVENSPVSDGSTTFTVPGDGNLQPGSVKIEVPVTDADGGGAGSIELRDKPNSPSAGIMVDNQDINRGTINYSTREVTITPVGSYKTTASQYSSEMYNTRPSA